MEPQLTTTQPEFTFTVYLTHTGECQQAASQDCRFTLKANRRPDCLLGASVPEFMADLRARAGIGASVLELSTLTDAWSGEFRGATWDEIDLETQVWTIQGERMKAGKPHRVSLSPALKGWALSRSNFPVEVIELALAHANSDATRASYARDGLLPQRTKLMKAWANYYAEPVEAGGVTPIRRTKGGH